MLFSQTPLTPFEEIINTLQTVKTTLYRYLHDKSYTPDEEDLEDIALICHLYFDCYGFLHYFQRRMIQRSLGLPETAGR